ncbi:nucleotidyltransferase domain protein [Leptospira interrogans serovar Medanensis str. L0448]|nr:nucleotidyltransferase domain protein [Leptospira interrogans str. UI 08452]EMN37537.1 nucleotidyltransferase domain protein [Leptospira interrogans serovar Medanensis str. L0448]EMN39342.1 nucleotidyltransferase domain protein [Leptospira interrogans str. L0996]EMN95781.1 nucleotidyltransferase domain protein [Leptospira interrogans serovar Medanensis str. UT053]
MNQVQELGGFESIDSDCDIRFIYKHETEWFLSVLPKKMSLEFYKILNLYRIFECARDRLGVKLLIFSKKIL